MTGSRRLLRRTGLLLAVLLAAGGLGLAILLLTLPDPLPLASRWPGTTAYMERERARASGDLAWEPVPLEAIPRHVRRAVIVAEDASFHRHSGVDWTEVRAAITEWWRDDGPLRGASTLTMQLARNLYLSPDRSWLRKARETLLAWRLEDRLTKHRILELYLNVVELGPGVYGVQAASRHYWGTDVSALGPRRAAELAATLPSPRADNPATRTPRFRWRAGLIFERAFGEEPPPPTEPEPPPLPAPDTAVVESVPRESLPSADSTPMVPDTVGKATESENVDPEGGRAP